MITSRKLKKLDDRIVRVVTVYGETLEGICTHHAVDYLECEFGFDEEGLQIADYIVLKSQIVSAEEWDMEAELGTLRAKEYEREMVFSLRKSFSEHLKRWEDNEVQDKYDHNAFEYSSQPTRDEFLAALAYQREREDSFIKLEGRRPLDDSFGLTENEVLTMVIEEMPAAEMPCVVDIEIREPRYKELKALEIKHYGSVYGEDFCMRNIDELYEYLDFRGAYADGKLVGAYHSFSSGGVTLIDGLLVDSGFRNKGIGTALIRDAAKLAARRAEETADKEGKTNVEDARWVLALHADMDDKPRELYERLGFTAVDTLYEYLCTDISALDI